MSIIEQLLEADHREIDGLLAAAEDAAAQGNAVAAYSAVDLFWARLAMHIRAEHLHLFPAVRLVSGPDIEPVLTRLRHDHDMFMKGLACAIKVLRPLKDADGESEVPSLICQSLLEIKERLEEHNSIEEKTVYSLTGPLKQTTEALYLSIQKELSNYPARFVK